jgi:hypothetical protein
MQSGGFWFQNLENKIPRSRLFTSLERTEPGHLSMQNTVRQCHVDTWPKISNLYGTKAEESRELKGVNSKQKCTDPIEVKRLSSA